MSDRFYPLPADKLLYWIIEESKQETIFGIHKDIFFKPRKTDPFRDKKFGKLLETPIGVAAGPHTQLAQNIIAAWLCGARFIELKTVQDLDDLKVSKPCIDMENEGYNCEWSQELRIEESFHEYAKAWVLLHVLRKFLGWNKKNDPGFIFNLSIGYDLKGIKGKKVQWFLDSILDAGDTIQEIKNQLLPFFQKIEDIPIPREISNNITLSTMHGCPPQEIEKIALYLIQERKLHTTIKLNPTLLGAGEVRNILNDNLRFKTQIPDQAFDHDLKWDDALEIIRNLESAAKKSAVDFGLNSLILWNRLTIGIFFLPRKR